MDLMVPQIGDFVQFRIAFPVGRSTMKFVWPKFSVWTIPSSFVREEVCGEVVYDWHSRWSTSQTKLYPAGVCIHLKLPGDVQTMYEFCEISLLNVLPPRRGSLTAAGWRMGPADGNIHTFPSIVGGTAEQPELKWSETEERALPGMPHHCNGYYKQVEQPRVV